MNVATFATGRMFISQPNKKHRPQPLRQYVYGKASQVVPIQLCPGANLRTHVLPAGQQPVSSTHLDGSLARMYPIARCTHCACRVLASAF